MEYKEKLAILELAEYLLRETNVKELETVEISHTEYDDGSKNFSINLTYHAEQKETETFYADNEELRINL